MGLVERGIENGEEIDPEYWLVLWHWEKPRFRRTHVWVQMDAQRVGYSRNRSREAAIRGVWLEHLKGQDHEKRQRAHFRVLEAVRGALRGALRDAA